jgi:hypothetical protein
MQRDITHYWPCHPTIGIGLPCLAGGYFEEAAKEVIFLVYFNIKLGHGPFPTAPFKKAFMEDIA